MNATASSTLDQNKTGVYNGPGNDDRPPVASVVLFSIQATFSVLANFLVVFLFTYSRHLLRSPHNRFILSLAITDILTSVSIFACPDFIFGEEFYNSKRCDHLAREFYCRFLWNSSLPFALGTTSLYISVAPSFERWLSVRRSTYYRDRFKILHMNMLILASWIAGLTACLPTVILVESVYDKHAESHSCQYYVLAKNKVSNICLMTGQFLFQTAIPLTFIILAYIDVFRGIKTSLRFAASARAVTVIGVKRLKKVTRVTVTATFVLVVSWVPTSVWYFLLSILNNPHKGVHDPLKAFVTLLVFSNGCINPFIYVFSNPELRYTIRDILR